jgi:hypothetical protein
LGGALYAAVFESRIAATLTPVAIKPRVAVASEGD